MWILYIVFMSPGNPHMQPVATFSAENECTKHAASSAAQLAVGKDSSIRFFCTQSGVKTWQQ
jgi:hypothetical protein